MTTKSLKTIRSLLPVGSINEIVQRTGFTRWAIYNVLNGKTKLNLNNFKIIDEATKIIQEFAKKKQDML